MPRQLTKRGHRLVFSNGIIFLSVAAIVLVIVTGAQVDRLIPLYAVGVFTSFTLSQAGMAKHHLREREPHWRKGLFVNGVGAFLSFVVDVVIIITKFTHGAWLIIVLVPAMVVFLVRLSRQYATEAEQLEHDVPVALAAPVLRRHVVLVFVDHLDLAAARAIQYGRSLQPDELRAVHFVIDQHAAEELADAWVEHGLTRIALDLVDCPDRRISRTAVETVARDLADGVTEVSVVLPERKYRGVWHRILHDQTADAIVKGVSLLPHANVTTVPFHFASKHLAKQAKQAAAAGALATVEDDGSTPVAAEGRRHDPDQLGPLAPTGGRGRPGPDGAGPAHRRDRHARGRDRGRDRRHLRGVQRSLARRRHRRRGPRAGRRHCRPPPDPARDPQPVLRAARQGRGSTTDRADGPSAAGALLTVEAGRILPAGHAELREDARHVDARRLLADVELRADLAVRGTRGHQLEDLALAAGELGETGLLRRRRPEPWTWTRPTAARRPPAPSARPPRQQRAARLDDHRVDVGEVRRRLGPLRLAAERGLDLSEPGDQGEPSEPVVVPRRRHLGPAGRRVAAEQPLVVERRLRGRPPPRRDLRWRRPASRSRRVTRSTSAEPIDDGARRPTLLAARSASTCATRARRRARVSWSPECSTTPMPSLTAACAVPKRPATTASSAREMAMPALSRLSARPTASMRARSRCSWASASSSRSRWTTPVSACGHGTRDRRDRLGQHDLGLRRALVEPGQPVQQLAGDGVEQDGERVDRAVGPQPVAGRQHRVEAVLDPTEVADGVGVVAVGRDEHARLAHHVRELDRPTEHVLRVAVATGVDECLTEHRPGEGLALEVGLVGDLQGPLGQSDLLLALTAQLPATDASGQHTGADRADDLGRGQARQRPQGGVVAGHRRPDGSAAAQVPGPSLPQQRLPRRSHVRRRVAGEHPVHDPDRAVGAAGPVRRLGGPQATSTRVIPSSASGSSSLGHASSRRS